MKEKIIPYLTYGLKGLLIEDKREDFGEQDWIEDIEIFNEGSVWQYCGYADSDLSIPLGEGEIHGFIYRKGSTYSSFHRGIKPLLYPLSYFKESAVNEWGYASGDDFIRSVESGHVPQKVYNELLSEFADVFGLIDSGLAIDAQTL